MQPTKDQAKQLLALDAIRHEDIDLSDIPEQGGRTDWVRGFSRSADQLVDDEWGRHATVVARACESDIK
jgi:hypothetical protein